MGNNIHVAQLVAGGGRPRQRGSSQDSDRDVLFALRRVAAPSFEEPTLYRVLRPCVITLCPICYTPASSFGLRRKRVALRIVRLLGLTGASMTWRLTNCLAAPESME